MSLCGCFPSCSCQLNIGTPSLLSLIGNGDPATGGWTLSANETVFSAVAANNAIGITPGGSYGHAPSIALITADTNSVDLGIGVSGLTADVRIADTDSVDLSIGASGLTADVRIDPASAAPVTIGPDGINIGCCTESGPSSVLDTDSVDLTIAGTVLSADVIPDTTKGVNVTVGGVGVKLQGSPAAVAVQDENRLRFNTFGDMVTLQDGLTLVNIGNSAQANVPALAGTTNVAFSQTVTNTTGTDIVFEYESTLFLALTSKASTTESYSFDFNLRHDIGTLTGGAVAFGNAAGRGIRVSNMEAPNFAAAPADQFAWAGQVTSRVYMPKASSFNIQGIIQAIRALNTNAWQTAVASGSYFMAYNRVGTISPARVGTPRSVTIV